ncbi:MAG TPA: competence/damage-inducible protein A [Bryobacteraceae bacterium]|nr:competence/damage-inducible protein A [Bryobacteraceae bacterium]
MRDAEIIAVGSELLTHSKIDTNSLYITEQLNALGVEVRRKLIVGDDRARLTEAIQHAVEHVEIVILTGGLGPTEDDLTRDAVAAALGRKLVFSEEIRAGIEERFRRFQRKMADINLRQAYLVEGAEPLENPRGTAPGQWIELDRQIVMMLPGPPGELKPLFANECIPRLLRHLPPQVIRTRFYRVAGMGESDLDALIAPVYTKFSNPATTILAGAGDIQVHLRARAATAEEADALLSEIAPAIEQLLGDRIYSHSGESLEAVVGQRLRERGATLSVAESCTGGMLAERITSIAGSSDYFVGGFLVYSDRMKIELLGVNAALIAAHSAVSEEVAGAMAEGARARTGSTYAISVTGEAGPDSATGAPPGTVFIGFAGPDSRVEARGLHLPGDRNRVRMLATQSALDFLRKKLAAD